MPVALAGLALVALVTAALWWRQRLRNAALQRQLDALAEIERELNSPGLPVRPRTGLPE